MSSKIGEVAERGGVSLQAIRYYEREGLLPKSLRLASGCRLFPDTRHPMRMGLLTGTIMSLCAFGLLYILSNLFHLHL